MAGRWKSDAIVAGLALQSARVNIHGNAILAAAGRIEITSLDSAALAAWAVQWQGSSHRPPEGGWDWHRVRLAEEKHRGHLGAAIWIDDRLIGLATLGLNGRAVVIRYLEGDPRPVSRTRGLVATVVMEVAACYARHKKRPEIWMWNVANQRLVNFYCETFGMTSAVHDGVVYCRKEL